LLFALDANVWLSEKLLRSAAGIAFLHAIRRMGGRILLPNSTRDEILAGVEKMGAEANLRIERGYVTVQALTGAHPKYSVPVAGEFRKSTEERLKILADLIVPFELTLKHHIKALSRVNEHRPPAKSREQYRDCLLWEVLLEVSEHRCILVSADKDFSEDAKNLILSKELESECHGNVSLYAKLADALKTFEKEIPPADVTCAIDSITEAVLPIAKENEKTQDFILGNRQEAKVDLFATEDPRLTAAIFDIAFDGFSASTYPQEASPQIVIRLTGDCMLDESGKVSNLKMDYINISDLSGERLRRVLYLRGLGGSPIVPYSVRVPL
jgi:hypothetical protein